MWEYEHAVEATAVPSAIWRLWADVERWGEWNAELAKIELRGPFAAGAEITMTPPGDDPIELRVIEAVENERFIDEARFDGLILQTAHRIERLDGARLRIV